MNKINWEIVALLTVVGLMTALFWYGVFHMGREVIGAKASDVSLGADVRWNCVNMQNSAHPIPLDFSTDDNGNWSVFLEDGTTVYGETLASGAFMKWTWQDATWMTDGKNVVYCESDAKSISILLAQ